MFLVFGIIMILAGIFAFRQGSALSMLASLASSSRGSEISGGWILAAILMIVGGAICCACKNGEKRSMVKGALFVFIAAAVISFAVGIGDMKIYGGVSAFVALIIGIWMANNGEKKEEKKEESPEPPAPPQEEQPEEPMEMRPPRNN